MTRGGYFVSLLFRYAMIVAALMLVLYAIYVERGGVAAWFLAILIGFSAATLRIRPLIVPTGAGTTALYSLAPAFLLAALFLIPAGPLVACIAFAVPLAGLITGTRPHKILFDLSLSILAYGGFSLYLDLGPRTTDPAVPPPAWIGVELLLAAAVLTAQFLVRSVAIRLERGDKAPHWGAFQRPALVESAYCLALSVLISVTARIHVALLATVYVNIIVISVFVERWRKHVRTLMNASQTQRVEEERWVA